jgi:hypothetical protein
MAVSMKMTVFWDVPCNLVEIYQHFRGAYCPITLMMEVASTSETYVNFYQATQCNIPQDSCLDMFCFLAKRLIKFIPFGHVLDSLKQFK